MVHSPSRTGGKLPTLEMTHVHLPRAARRRAVALMRAHREHPAHARPNVSAVRKPMAPFGSVPLPPENGVRSVARSMPVRMSLHSFKMLTAM